MRRSAELITVRYNNARSEWRAQTAAAGNLVARTVAELFGRVYGLEKDQPVRYLAGEGHVDWPDFVSARAGLAMLLDAPRHLRQQPIDGQGLKGEIWDPQARRWRPSKGLMQ
jgi:hypothetical protein